MKKRFFLTLAVAVTLMCMLCTAAFASTKLAVNGQEKELVAYNIKGNNYFKLRDIANILNGTDAQFDVLWDDKLKAINLVTKAPYSTNDGISLNEIKNPVAYGSAVSIYKDGGKVLLGAYNIEGNNYFKLRDLAAALDFGVVWNESTKTIGIDTSISYEFPAPSSEFALSPEVFTYIGMKKEQLDKILGEPTPKMMYNTVHVGDTYPCGIEVTYSSLAQEKIVLSAKIPLSMMFYNCPEILTQEMLEKVFFEYETGAGYNMEANYCGGKIIIKLFPGEIKASDLAEVSSSAYNTQMTEVVYVGREWMNTANKTPRRLYREFLRKEHETGMFSGDIYPYYELNDMDHDGKDDLYALSFDGYEAIFTVRNGEVKLLYKLSDKESMCSYTEVNVPGFKWKVAESIDENTKKFYTLDANGRKVLYSTIKVVMNENTYSYYSVWLNGKLLQEDTPEYNNAFQNYMFNYVESLHYDWYEI